MIAAGLECNDHCFCKPTFTGHVVCCGCGERLAPQRNPLLLTTRVRNIGAWVDQNLFFANSQGRHPK